MCASNHLKKRKQYPGLEPDTVAIIIYKKGNSLANREVRVNGSPDDKSLQCLENEDIRNSSGPLLMLVAFLHTLGASADRYVELSTALEGALSTPSDARS